MIQPKRGKYLALLLSSLLILTQQTIHAFDYYQSDENGVKASAMGRAFVAVADDPSSLYWNPAGLAYLKDLEIGGTFALIPRLTLSAANFLLPFDPISIALEYDERYFKQGETLAFNILLGGGSEIAPSLALGGNLGFVFHSFDKSSADQVGYGINLGIGGLMKGDLIGLGEEWAFGSMLRSPDLVLWASTKPTENNMTSGFALTSPPRWTLIAASFQPRGAAFRRGNELTMAFDLELIPWTLTSLPQDHNPSGSGVSQPQTLELRPHLGLEKKFNGIPIRGGLYTQQTVGAGEKNQLILVPTLGTEYLDRNWQIGVSLEDTGLVSLQTVAQGLVLKVHTSVRF